MSFKRRNELSRKRPTQVELERENSELKRRCQRLESRLKQALRQLQQYEDVQFNISEAIDEESEATFQDLITSQQDTHQEDEHITLTLPNGSVKRIRKKT